MDLLHERAVKHPASAPPYSGRVRDAQVIMLNFQPSVKHLQDQHWSCHYPTLRYRRRGSSMVVVRPWTFDTSDVLAIRRP